MGEIEETKQINTVRETSPTSAPSDEYGRVAPTTATPEKRTWKQRVMEPGSVWQIIIAALLAIAIGLAVTTTVEEVPKAAIAILAIPGTLWLRALKAVVLPMIVTAMIMAIQRLRNLTENGGKAGQLARWTVGYYVITTIVAVCHSCILTAFVWSKLMQPVSQDQLEADSDTKKLVEEREKEQIHDVVVKMFESFIPNNIVNAMATDSLLAVLITAVVLGYVLKPGGALMRGVAEIDQIVTRVITILIYGAPIGVFFLIMPNLMRLNIEEIGLNLGILIGGTLSSMFIHLFILIPIIFFAFTRQNPYKLWFKCSPAWVTAWGTASSAATMPVTLRCVLERGVPVTVTKFAIPLGTLINMDGTAIYFPVVVTFLAATQGITLDPTQYVIMILLSTLASIGVTPIPSASLVLIVMICGSINVPVTGMYAVVIAIDWFLDRFRTAMNVSGDIFASVIVTKITGIRDEDGVTFEDDLGLRQEDLAMAQASGNDVESRGQQKY